MSTINVFKFNSIFIIILIWTSSICDCGEHYISGNDYYIGSTIKNYTLFTRNSILPKSYIIKYLHIEDPMGAIVYNARITSNAAVTSGSGRIYRGPEKEKLKNCYVNASVEITNATNFWVNIELRAAEGFGPQFIEALLTFDSKPFRPRSFAFICTINENKSKSQYRQIEYGKRRPGDFILVIGKKNVITQDSRLPRYLIEFKDDGLVLTSVTIKLNTTQAIMFNNKVAMTEHQFSGTVYGLDRNVFNAIYIIYGYTT